MKEIFGTCILLLALMTHTAFAQTDSTSVKLQQYKDWLEQGIITETEYQELKDKVLKPLKEETTTSTDQPKPQKGKQLPDGHYKGVRAGLSIGFAKNLNSPYPSNLNPLIGPNLFLFYQYYKQHFMIMVELGYVQKGFSKSVQYTDAQGNNLQQGEEPTKFGYIEMPVVIGARLRSVNIFGGLSNGIILFGKTQYHGISVGGNTNPIEYKLPLDKRYEAGFIIGVSNDFVIAKKYAIPLDVRYNVGLNTPTGSRMQYVSITTGFKF